MSDSPEPLSCGGCGTDIAQESLDPQIKRKIARQPCFNREASRVFGRIHLAVAPECNVQCNFCLRDFDCVNESRPGVTSQVLSPEGALERVRQITDRFDNICTIGIAGPGESLFNEATIKTFRLARDAFPGLHLCVSSNGLLLPDRVDILHELGVDTVTVTMSAVDPKVGAEIYSWVYYEDKYYRGIEGAELILSRQLDGIMMAVEKGMLVKVNSVMIPGVNDHHMTAIAQKASELGAFMQNIMPLIPQYKFAHLKPPAAKERKQAQDEASQYIRQMRHCRQCRADAIGLLGKDLSQEFFKPAPITESKSETPAHTVALTSSTPDGMVDLHFGNAPIFLIYELSGEKPRLVRKGDNSRLSAKLLSGWPVNAQ
ncbi:MAG: nitrogenase cofactor biosynthesis protein NifB [Dehalococcoidia bacterium]